jgi:hypothetical protein
MSKLLRRLWCVTFPALLLVCATAYAGTGTKSTPVPLYDASKETTLEGKVSSLSASVPGAIRGGHMFVSTSSGTVDGHLGPYALSAKNHLTIPAGTNVKMVGVMATVGGKQVFLVRTIDTGETKYTIRNEHGFPIIPGAVQPTKSINFVSPKGAR